MRPTAIRHRGGGHSKEAASRGDLSTKEEETEVEAGEQAGLNGGTRGRRR
jgi:hypothetical protein